ncbi:class A beta-lactamase [Falsiroseomonas tokyonensis]|uniref:beta-lactamase n=2 Tax=Falsiroseomonas tokyonensis TaxID=430521 RepID=A0ABV7BZC7_9PROT|nr:class A beta-lactamase [Falsiroseomonas tokyonensis]
MTMRRRSMMTGMGLAGLWTAMPWRGVQAAVPEAALTARLAELEKGTGGRLGVALLDLGSGRRAAHRGAERFPMCSTFKLLAAAAVLRRVEAGQLRLDQLRPFRRADLVPYSPATEAHADGPGLTLAALCEAAVTLSDNTAANLLLGQLGGPEGLTAQLRRWGDMVTRLDRWEPALNEGIPGDPRDTTTPEAMLGLIRTVTLGDGLAAEGRAQLMAWLRGNRTGDRQLRAGLPAGWTAAEKTGSNGRSIANDVGLLLPPGGRPPVLVTAYLAEATIPAAQQPAVLAAVAREAVAAFGPR